ncbi:MAG TPA: class I SAM-dependent methyltransferase [Thermoanaerobaculia bacterium]|jgi:SAM-dependent methyltransferase|nr:class I SAM-dependent methyltransferase [Thermoanaerobaculia bacterium]
MLSLARRVVYRHWQRFHGVRRLELATLSRYLELSPGQRIVDVGSGKGAFAGTLGRRGLDAVGVDPSLPALAIAKRWVDRGGRFLGAAGEELPLAAGTFDRAVSVCVLEHTRDDAAVLAEVRRVLRPDGLFALSVDCLNSPHVDESFRRHHVAEYRCVHLYDDVRIRQLLGDAGFEVLESRYLFTGRLAIAILRWGSRFHYRGPFILLFPVIYPFLWMDHILGRRRKSGMILAVKAKASVAI